MYVSLESLRSNAREILKDKKWLSSVQADEREVTVYTDGYHCESSSKFDVEFVTNDVEEAINYLYPQP